MVVAVVVFVYLVVVVRAGVVVNVVVVVLLLLRYHCWCAVVVVAPSLQHMCALLESVLVVADDVDADVAYAVSPAQLVHVAGCCY